MVGRMLRRPLPFAALALVGALAGALAAGVVVGGGACANAAAPAAPASTTKPGAAAAPTEAAPKPRPSRATVVVETAGGPVPFSVELAMDDQQRARGLMFREKLAEDEGMLFVFDRSERQSFWMKNTYIPLDMIFIDEEGVVVGIVENAEPQTTTSRRVDKDSRYVLEVAGGTSRRLGIAAGSKVRFEGVPGHPAKAASREEPQR